MKTISLENVNMTVNSWLFNLANTRAAMNEWIVNRRFAYIETSLVVLQYDDATKKGG